MAISELFLDTELDDASFLRLRDTLRASRLAPQELDTIYYDEIAPTLYRNLNTPAGVWSGFDVDWLEREIQQRTQRLGFPPLTRLRRYLVTRSTIGDWRRLRAMVAAP
jgi:hypothetical protein